PWAEGEGEGAPAAAEDARLGAGERLHERSRVDGGAVAAAEVLDVPDVAVEPDLGVLPRHGGVVDVDRADLAAPDDDRLAVEGDGREARLSGRGDEEQPGD